MMIRKAKIALSVLAILVITSFVPQTKATPSGHIFLTEIGTFKDLFAVDVDSAGRVFIRINNTVWRSTDGGVSFAKVLDMGVESAGSAPLLLRVDGNDRIFVNIWDGSAYDLYRSTDYGESWQKVLENTPRLWRLAEKSDGSLFINTYDTDLDDLIYKSEDGGEHWTVWQNLTGQVTDHIHFVRVNPYNDDIWIGCGDQTGAPLGYHNGTAWTWVYNMSNDKAFTDAIFDENYVYFMPDRSSYAIYRIPHRGSWSEKEEVFNVQSDDTREGLQGYAYSMMAARYEDGLMVVPTDRTTVYASWDGEHWIKVVEDPHEGTDAWRFSYISQRRPIYVANYYTDKLYRLDLQKEDVQHLWYEKYVSETVSSITNAENFEYKLIVHNNTVHYLDLTNVALSNVQASIIGLGQINISNSGFELGDESNWTFWTESSGIPHAHGVTSLESCAGTYSLNINKTSENTEFTYAFPTNLMNLKSQAEYKWFLSVYAKSNLTSPLNILALVFAEWNVSTYSILEQYRAAPDTTWQEYNLTATSVSSNNLSIGFKFQREYLGIVPDYKLYLDEVKVIQIPDVRGYVVKEANGTTINYKVKQPTTSLQNTTNPTITIGGQQISYSGQLTNGTESTPQSLSGILTGMVKVEANIGGNGQAILKITGTRVLYEDSIILQGRKDNTYYGRYYATFSPTTSTNDLIAVTNLQANITSLLYSSDKLTLTIDSPSGTTSTTKVYCGDRGQPITVSGATSWSYNSETKIATINVHHTSPKETMITIIFADYTKPKTTISLGGVLGNNEWFVSKVTVALSALDDISGVDKTEYSFDNLTWFTYTTPFNITYEGTTTIYYKSIDNAGNVETVKTETIRIDKTAPSGSIIINNGDAYTTSTSVTLTLAATDDTSGVYQVRYSNDGVWDTESWEPSSQEKIWTLPSGDGTKTVYCQIKDSAGLISPLYQYSIILDTTKPIANAGNDQTVTEDTSVTFDGSASQDENGITSYTWTFIDLTLQTMSGKTPTYTFQTPGIYTITLNVTDAAGNWETDTVVITVLHEEIEKETTVFPIWTLGLAVLIIGTAIAITILIKKENSAVLFDL